MQRTFESESKCLLLDWLLQEFTDPWESTHDSVHVWVGGTMERSFAAADPVFYMHHAFVDYVWERFRQRQRAACGVDPAADYPPDDADAPEHSAVSPMVAMDFLRNRDGIADYWINNWFNYTDSPTCANNCGNSPDLYCDSAINRCVSNSRFDFGNPVSTTPIPLTTATTTTVTTTTATTTTETTTTTRPTPIPITSTSESPRNTPTPPRNITTTRPPTPSPTPIPSATPSPITTTSTGPLTTTPIASCTDGGSYCRKVNEGQKPYEGKCSKDPYDGSCARRPRPATADAVVNAICRNELPRSPSLQAVFDAISSELKRAQRFPPESEQTWFRMKPDEEKDCRCLDSLIRDPLVAYLKEGRQLNQYGPKL
ncbi:hypothetical protein DPMN_176641 [Dreissena polymorpha]|uniref:Tyrosinase copper-binding domain-containing protein n=1 Tax=Dreissena polymorpha TaxID=45954 RepID=A0A9D4EAJ0_DREPO|nr:hypothetical protein DPMN_176641 [Dreissena polymorpha]